MRVSRRSFLATAAALPGLTAWSQPLEALQPFDFAQGGRAAAGDPWTRAADIVRGIRVPPFPSRDFKITKYGAVGDGVASCTDAIRTAIAACRAAGGGHVVVPAGRFLTGAIRLESGVDLHLSKGARAYFDDAAQQVVQYAGRLMNPATACSIIRGSRTSRRIRRSTGAAAPGGR